LKVFGVIVGSELESGDGPSLRKDVRLSPRISLALVTLTREIFPSLFNCIWLRHGPSQVFRPLIDCLICKAGEGSQYSVDGHDCASRYLRTHQGTTPYDQERSQPAAVWVHSYAEVPDVVQGLVARNTWEPILR